MEVLYLQYFAISVFVLMPLLRQRRILVARISEVLVYDLPSFSDLTSRILGIFCQIFILYYIIVWYQGVKEESFVTGKYMEMPAQLNSLEDENTRIRASAIIEMGRTGNRDGVQSIIGVLANREEVDWLRACAAIALGRLAGEEVMPPLVNALQDDSIIVSRAAVSALGDARNPQAIPHLKGILENRDKEELHAVTVKVLGEIGGHDIMPTLLRALESSNELVRVRAALALGEFRTDEVIPHFLKLLQDDSDSLRAIAASSLGLLGDKRAVEPLITALGDEAATVRAIAASSLGCLADGSVIPSLEKALDDVSEIVRKQATAALSKIRRREAL